ncbi:hypothetical protein L6164_037190 [Bauhinia variegata]|uniref:Uncharacterized protein n=1 Tax=Bauhinia variegata TaxID=167791 RepID=A0ACB9KJH3_BAUVA|nr:hypothetical protein L6164_037190 [Bauhinia variegata]
MVDAILSYAIERLGDLLIEEAKFLYSVNAKVKHLQRELKLIQCLLQDADAKQHKTNSLRKVIAEIRDIAFDAEDTIDVYALEVASRKGSSAK